MFYKLQVSYSVFLKTSKV